MADPKPQDAAKAMTVEEAAKAVKRTVVSIGEDKKPVEKQVAVKAAEVLGFKDYGTHVVVVTSDGQKFSSAQAA